MKKQVMSVLDHIRLEAFLLSERAGHPSGLDEIFWTQAEKIVHGRTAVVAGAGKAPAKAKPAATVKPKAAKRKVMVKKSLHSKKESTGRGKSQATGKRAR